MNNRSRVTDWAPLVSRQAIEARAHTYAQIRQHFTVRQALEVDTPIVNRHTVTDPHIDSIGVTGIGPKNYYLHTSPEYAMKRLLAFFKRDIYQLCKVFRGAERGKYHHTEFTLLEWYRVACGYQDLMREVDELVTTLLRQRRYLAQTEFTTYQNIFIEYCGFDPWCATRQDYVRAGAAAGLALQSHLSICAYQELLLDQVIAPRLPKDSLTFIHDFPAQQAALANINHTGVAERFELYLGDIELANGFQELTDTHEHLQRFQEHNVRRARAGKVRLEIDRQFIAALVAGLPESSGVALGIDRLLMTILRVTDIKDVLAFTGD